MRYIAITGGIGSGKSYVCRLLQERGISVYDCDAGAKRLMASDLALQSQLQGLVGEEVFSGHVLQKRVLVEFLLASEENKQAVDDIIHPAVAADFIRSGKKWLESAILFDSGFYRRVPLGFTVCVSAPEEVRIGRVMARDHITRERAMEWIGRQWTQEKVERLCDFVIVNDGRTSLDGQIELLLNKVRQV